MPVTLEECLARWTEDSDAPALAGAVAQTLRLLASAAVSVGDAVGRRGLFRA